MDTSMLIAVIIGNSTRTIILLLCEVAIALISSCFPSIFSLVTHIINKHFPRSHCNSGSPDDADSSNIKFRIHFRNEEAQERGRANPEQPEDAQKPIKISKSNLFGSIRGNKSTSHSGSNSDLA